MKLKRNHYIALFVIAAVMATVIIIANDSPEQPAKSTGGVRSFTDRVNNVTPNPEVNTSSSYAIGGGTTYDPQVSRSPQSGSFKMPNLYPNANPTIAGPPVAVAAGELITFSAMVMTNALRGPNIYQGPRVVTSGGAFISNLLDNNDAWINQNSVRPDNLWHEINITATLPSAGYLQFFIGRFFPEMDGAGDMWVDDITVYRGVQTQVPSTAPREPFNGYHSRITSRGNWRVPNRTQPWSRSGPTVTLTNSRQDVSQSWTRSGTAITVSPGDQHQMTAGMTVTVNTSSDVAALPVGSYTIALVPTTRTYVLTGLNAGATSGHSAITHPVTHDLAIGMPVEIASSSQTTPLPNATYTVASIPTIFTYTLTGVDSGATSGTATTWVPWVPTCMSTANTNRDTVAEWELAIATTGFNCLGTAYLTAPTPWNFGGSFCVSGAISADCPVMDGRVRKSSPFYAIKQAGGRMLFQLAQYVDTRGAAFVGDFAHAQETINLINNSDIADTVAGYWWDLEYNANWAITSGIMNIARNETIGGLRRRPIVVLTQGTYPLAFADDLGDFYDTYGFYQAGLNSTPRLFYGAQTIMWEHASYKKPAGLCEINGAYWITANMWWSCIARGGAQLNYFTDDYNGQGQVHLPIEQGPGMVAAMSTMRTQLRNTFAFREAPESTNWRLIMSGAGITNPDEHPVVATTREIGGSAFLMLINASLASRTVTMTVNAGTYAIGDVRDCGMDSACGSSLVVASPTCAGVTPCSFNLTVPPSTQANAADGVRLYKLTVNGSVSTTSTAATTTTTAAPTTTTTLPPAVSYDDADDTKWSWLPADEVDNFSANDETNTWIAYGQSLGTGAHNTGDYPATGGSLHTNHVTSLIGGQATLSFDGTGVQVYGAKGPSFGQASVTLDGVLQEHIIDSYAVDSVRQTVLFVVAGLTPGPHTLVITSLNARNAASTGNNIVLDKAIESQSPPTTTTIAPTTTTTIAPGSDDACPASRTCLFGGNPVPGGLITGGDSTFTLGHKFTTSAPGSITHLRFFRHPTDTATRTLRLWNTSDTATPLATATSSVTTSGWRNVVLASPVNVAVGQTYIVSIDTPTNGSYVWTHDTFESAVVSGVLTAPASATTPNGLFDSPAGVFPTSSFNESFYSVDVAYNTEAVVTTTTAAPTTTTTTTTTTIPTTTTTAPTFTCIPSPIGILNDPGGVLSDENAATYWTAPSAAGGPLVLTFPLTTIRRYAIGAKAGYGPISWNVDVRTIVPPVENGRGWVRVSSTTGFRTQGFDQCFTRQFAAQNVRQIRFTFARGELGQAPRIYEAKVAP